MAQHQGRQGPWPRMREFRWPDAKFVTPDAYLNSARSVAGPLRTGTSPNVGPRGLYASERTRYTDYGTDNLTPRSFDPMGTSDTRAPEFPSSQFISRELRGRRR